jgi:hypothetical protein
MDEEELRKVFIKTNSAELQPVNEDVLRKILHLVVKYPLPEDRMACQEEIRKMVAQNSK